MDSLEDIITNIRRDVMDLAFQYDNSLRGTGIVKSDTYSISKMFDWTKEEAEGFRSKVLPLFKMKTEVDIDVLDVLNKLRSIGCEIVIVISKSNNNLGSSYKDTKNSLEENKIPFNRLIIDSILPSKIEDVINEDINKSECSEGRIIRAYVIYNGDNFNTNTKIVYDFRTLFDFFLGLD